MTPTAFLPSDGGESLWRRHAVVRLAVLVTTGALLLLAAWNLAFLVPFMASRTGAIGVDYNLYMDAAGRWLAGGSFYLERQLAGPYPVQPGDILYPPTTLWLLVPFRVVPAILWWAIPIAVIAWAIWRVRPAWWIWPVLALVLWYPRTQAMFLYGNPGIWIVAAVAAGTRWRWASVLVLVKPSLGPIALFGVRHRSWWIALGVLVLAGLPFAALWLDYAKVLTNADAGIGYSLMDVPPTIAPILAWLARTRADPRQRPGVSGTVAAIEGDQAVGSSPPQLDRIG